MAKFFRYSLFLTALLFLGCKAVLYKMYDIRQPAFETPVTLTKFMSSCKLDTTELLGFRDKGSITRFRQAGIDLPDARFFNRKKELVDYRSTASDCNALVWTFIEKSDSINFRAPVKGALLDDYLKGVVELRTGQPYQPDAQQQYEVYMVVYWAKFLGKLNKKKVFDWQELVKEANLQGKKIKMILVNADYQASWGLDKSALPKL